MHSAAASVDQARVWARLLEEREAGRDGDLDMARARLETRYGIPSSTFYSLRRRPPKSIPAHLYDRLAAAVEDACSRQIRSLEAEIAIAEKAYGNRDRLVRIARAAHALAQAVLGDDI